MFGSKGKKPGAPQVQAFPALAQKPQMFMAAPNSMTRAQAVQATRNAYVNRGY